MGERSLTSPSMEWDRDTASDSVSGARSAGPGRARASSRSSWRIFLAPGWSAATDKGDTMTAGHSGAPKERLKVGVIGGGAIAQVAHLPALKKMKGVEVQAICDTDLPKARALADRF